MDLSYFVLNGQSYTISAEMRHALSDRLPALPLGPGLPAIRKRLFVCADSYGRQRGLTLFEPTEHESANFADAVRVATQLEPDLFATFIDTGVGQWGSQQRPMIAWVEDWVRGLPLDTVLSQPRLGLTATQLRGLILRLAGCLQALRSIGAVHGHISSRDVILYEPRPGSLNPTSSFKLVDLSQSKLVTADELEESQIDELLFSDDSAILEILAQAHNHVLRQPDTSSEQRSWLKNLGDYLISASTDLAGGNATVDPASLKAIGESRATGISKPSPSLTHPFDYISAEHIASDELLYRIFADSCPWIEEVSRPNPTLVEGPRGCGKSMLLRWLSIRTQLAGDPTHRRLDNFEVGAFYVSCTAELQSRLGHLDSIEKALRFEDRIVHYFNLVVLREVVTTLRLMSSTNVTPWGIDARFGRSLFDTFAGYLTGSTTLFAGVDAMEQLSDLCGKELKIAQDALRDAEAPERLTPPSFLSDLAAFLARNSPFFVNHRVTFCLDDYSVHRIPEPVQQVLNRVVFGLRSAHYIFKISAENRGFFPFDTRGARIDGEREMTRVDIGKEFVNLNSAEAPRRFARDLLANRLAAAGWEASPEELIGVDSISQFDFARAARDAAHKRTPRPLYSGLPCIADLCSGDVATLLHVYRRILEAANAGPDTKTRIADRIQHDAIRSVSREMLSLVRSHQPFGQQMLNVAQEFCGLARFALENGLVQERGSLEPMKRTRIEVDGLSLPNLELGDSVESGLVKELMRRAIFIDIGPGSARHAEKVTTRLMLRRIFLPAFQLSLAKNGQFMWSEAKFLRFLQDPAGVRRIEQQALLRQLDPHQEQPQLDLVEDGER